ncbi:carbohydrate kinase family protein [Halomarina oriensis]|uniref:Carbohydrate kinase n=1 Tax=Halomarina oriensis TaxID=671145 RepID=A0A6B0GVT9_9EURY|nr:carbohydrate kinase [Halomarina oriensis]MWG36255.1 carbohydrate kinase [Halomarina oriensis]
MTHRPDVLVAGETLVDFLPGSAGPLASVERFTRRPGGAPANVAVGLATLGHAPWFWTRVGADPFGDLLAETLADHGVPDRFVERDPEAKTTLAFVEHDDAKDRAFTFYRDGTADTRLRPGTVPDGVLASVGWVYVGGVALASGSSREATFDLVERARERGAMVVFDPNARPELWDDDFAAVATRALEATDVVKATPEDLAAVGLEGSPAALAEAVLDGGPHTALVTRGAKGAHASSTADAPWGADTVDHAGYPVDPVDTTGAGDAFTAGALAALVDGESLPEVLAFANAVAAVTTTAEGAMTALPDRGAVRAFRSDRDGA